MREMSKEEFVKATEGKTINDFVDKVKTLPIFKVYEHAVKSGKEDTSNMLEMVTMMAASSDEELPAL